MKLFTDTFLLPMLQNLPFAAYACDEKGRLLFFNRAAEALWGYAPSLGKQFFRDGWKIFYTDGQPMPPDAFPMAKALRLKKAFIGEEFLYEMPDRSLKYMQANPCLVFNGKQQLVGAYNMLMDITEQKKEMQHHQMLTAIIDSAEDAIIVKDLKGKVISWNAGATNLFGYQRGEMIGQPITRIIPEDRYGEETDILARIAGGEQIHHFETVRKDKYGKLIPISLTISPIKDAHGKVIGASKIAREIIQEVATRKKMKRYTTELEKENQYKDQFVSLASHELKTPLTSAKAYAQLLMKAEEGNEKNYKLASKAYQNLTKLEQLTNDLLDISKIKAGKITYRSEMINLKSLILTSIENIQQTTSTHMIVPGQISDVSVVGDPLRLEQVLVNLLSNAMKYSPAANRVDVYTEISGSSIIVSIRDYGIGIPKESINLLFNRYFRVENQVEKFPGLGIGLFIAAEILKRHQGSCWIESELKKGSTFFFSLPIAAGRK